MKKYLLILIAVVCFSGFRGTFEAKEKARIAYVAGTAHGNEIDMKNDKATKFWAGCMVCAFFGVVWICVGGLDTMRPASLLTLALMLFSWPITDRIYSLVRTGDFLYIGTGPSFLDKLGLIPQLTAGVAGLAYYLIKTNKK